MSASVILTYRGSEPPDRQENLFAVLAWLARTPEYEVIVVEQDALPRLAAGLPHPRCRVVFAYNPGPFNKAWGLNVGMRFAENPVLAFSDADVITHGMLEKSVALCRNNFNLVKPYRRLIDLTPAETAQVRAGNHNLVPERSDNEPPNREGISEVIVLCGGLFLIRREAFIHLGGWDERFRGWGGEDDALTWKVQRTRMSCVELDETPALHLWHPRSFETTYGQPFYASNRDLLTSYRRYSDAELLRLAEVQKQTLGNREKYRPDA